MAGERKDDSGDALKRRQDPLVERLRPDPTQPPRPTLSLSGLLGDSDRPGYRRLYFTRDLGYYAEFRAEDVLDVAAVPPEEPPLEGFDATQVTIDGGATIEYTHVLGRAVAGRVRSRRAARARRRPRRRGARLVRGDVLGDVPDRVHRGQPRHGRHVLVRPGHGADHDLPRPDVHRRRHLRHLPQDVRHVRDLRHVRDTVRAGDVRRHVPDVQHAVWAGDLRHLQHQLRAGDLQHLPDRLRAGDLRHVPDRLRPLPHRQPARVHVRRGPNAGDRAIADPPERSRPMAPRSPKGDDRPDGGAADRPAAPCS